MWGREFPFLERHSKNILFRWRVWSGMRSASLHYQGMSAQSYFESPGQHGHCTNFTNKSLETSWVQRISNSINRHQAQCWFRKQPLPISYLEFSYNCRINSNGLPLSLWALKHCTDFAFLDYTEGAWEMFLFHLGDKQYIASSNNQGKIALTNITKRDWKRLGCNVYSNQWKDTTQMHVCSW